MNAKKEEILEVVNDDGTIQKRTGILLEMHRGCGFLIDVWLVVNTPFILDTRVSANSNYPGRIDIRLILPWWSIFTFGVLRLLLRRVADKKTRKIWDKRVPKGIYYRFI